MSQRDRRTIASYPTYPEAERAVDYLSDQGFPVERTAIIGHDLQLVEQVVGRVGFGRAALSGAASGALPGALIGWLFGLLDWLNPVLSSLLLALYGLIFGAVIGALLGLLRHREVRTVDTGRANASVAFDEGVSPWLRQSESTSEPPTR
ncbi:general stress protein [Streptomyces lydicus]|uniref:general stress protein n=1 Tax=Streptomyces lydicus TaxID=47763 RepID=UPI00368A41F8